MLQRRGVVDPVRQGWAAELVVSWLVDAVVHWLEDGVPERDEELVDLVSRSLPPMVEAWAED